MHSPNRVGWAIWRVALVVGALACAPQAWAAFFLDLTFVSRGQVDLVLKSDARSSSSVEGIEVVLQFDSSFLELAGNPEFKEVLTGPDFELPACGQRLLPTGFIRSNCGGYFSPKRPLLESGELLSWSINVLPGSPQTTLSVMVGLNEDDPIELSQTLPVPEPGTTALMLVGLGVLILLTVRRRAR